MNKKKKEETRSRIIRIILIIIIIILLLITSCSLYKANKKPASGGNTHIIDIDCKGTGCLCDTNCRTSNK